MKRNMTGKISSILISVLFLCVMFIASSTGAKAYASEYVDVATDVGFNVADIETDGNGYVYVVDFDTGNIVRMDNDGTNRIVLGTIENAQRLAVDDVNQYIYVTNDSNVVQRMNIDGTDITDFLTLNNVVRSVAVDEIGRVYVGAVGVGILRVEQDGTDSTIIRSEPTGTILNIAVDDVNEYIYYAWTRRGSFHLYKLNIDGSDTQITVAGGPPAITDVYADDNGDVYYTQYPGIFRIGSDLSIYNGMYGSIAVDENGGMYVSKGQTIHKIRMMTVEQLMAETRECIVKHIDNGNIVDIGSSLISKFDNFSANFDLENNSAALNQLDAFVNELSAQRGNKIAVDVAEALIARAQILHNLMTGEKNTVKKIVALKEYIANHVDYGLIEVNTASGLVSKLDNCSATLDKEDNTAAANQLNAFINEVSAQRGNKISEDVADVLIATAQALLEMIEAPVDGEEAMTNEEVPVATEESEVLGTMPLEEPQTNEEPTIIEESTEANPSVSEEVEVIETPTTVEEPATVDSSAVEEESEASAITPADELQTSEEITITGEAAEAIPPVDEGAELTEVPTVAETPTGLE